MINKKYKFNKQILNESLKVDEIFVYLDEKDESAILQNELFKLGFLWCDGSNDVFHPENFFDEEEEMIICISLKDKDLSYISSIEEFRDNNSSDVRLYSFSDLEQIIDIISGKPNYRSKQKPSRILEKYFHENYKYTTIPFKIETVSELNKIKLFLNNNKELFINLNFNIDETFTYITNIYLYKHINIIIEFMINMDNKLIFAWDQYDDFVSYIDKNSYEKIYNIDDLQNNIINNIIKYGNPYPQPKYEPKNKIIRESLITEGVIHPDYHYDVIIIAIYDQYEFKSIEDILKKYSYDDNELSQYKDKSAFSPIYIRLKNDYYRKLEIKGCAFLTDLERVQIRMGFKYERIFTVDDVKKGVLESIIKHGVSTIEPTYKPKDRIVRESNSGDFKIIIKIDNNEQGKIVQEKLFELGFIWILSSSNIKNFNFSRPYVVIYANLSNNQLTYCDNINNSYINRVNNKSFDYIYPKVFNFNELDLYLNLVKNKGVEEPSYKPKNKIVREGLKNINLEIVYKCENKEEFNDIQRLLFNNGYKWGGSSTNYRNSISYPIFIFSGLHDKIITKTVADDYSFKRFIQGDPDVVYQRIFDKSVLDEYSNIIRTGIIDGPSYKPKQKPIRESILPYEKAVIYVGNDYENTIIQETLFKNGFYWVEHGNNIQYQITPFLLVTYFNNKIIRYSNNRQSIEQAKKGLYPDAYPKLYYFESLGEYISLLKNKGIVPNYKSKQKPIRENILIESVKLHYKYPYKKIIITINNIEESNEFLEYFKNIPQFVNIYDNIIDLLKYANENKEFPIYISFYKNSNEKILYGWDNLKHLERYNDIDSYGKIFTVNDIKNDFITNILRHGDVNPNYNPKSKTIRETKLNEEVADNIHLSDDVVLNYYDDDAYAFLFYNGYPKGQFIIEQGLTHKNMMGNYLYNLKDEEYMKVYYTQQNDDYLYDRVEESEYKGRLWINNKVISFWDLSYTKQDVTALKNILKIIENKLNIEINNDWLIEFFDIEKQRLFLITLDKYFKGELDEDDSKKMSTSYYEYLKQQHLNTKIKKPVPYGYGSKNPKYKSLQYRQTLYQESLNNDTINIKNIPDVSRELNVQQQRKIFKKGDTVYIRPDAKNYFTDIDESAEKFIGKTAIIKGVYTIKHIYSKKSLDKYYISDIDINNIIPKNINYRKNDIVVFVANDDIDDEYDYAFFYRCLYNESLSEPNYNKKNKIIRESNNINFLKNDQYDSFCFKIDDNMQEIKKYLNDLNINTDIINDNWESKEYVFFTKRLNSSYDKFIVYKCNYEYFTENSFSRDLGLKISPLFNFDELKDYISKYIKPSYQPKNKIDRTFESNKWYPYRFKTEQEFIKEFGHWWIDEVGWNDDNQMDYLFGQPYPFNVNDGDHLPFIEDTHNGYYDTWYINWKMLTKNEPKKPTYQSKSKITRTFESNKWYPYRFKTKQEFIDEFGDNWSDLVQYSWCNHMNYLFGQLYPFDVTKETQRLNNFGGWNISWDMLTKNKPTTPSYEPKNKIVRENLITEDCDFVILPNGKKITFVDSDAIPFMYINNEILIGNPTERHFDTIFRYLYSKNIFSEEKIKDIYFNSPIKGRLWLNSKVISFWDYIKKDDLVKVISDIKEKLNINIDNTWLLDYYENEEFDDKLGKNLIPINDYLTGDYKDNTNNIEYQKKKKQHIDTTFKHYVPSGYGSKSSKYKPLEYRQLLYQEKILSFNKK